MTTVHVVMCNDFPDSVFATGEAANRYIKLQKKQQNGHSLHWRAYEFEVKPEEIEYCPHCAAPPIDGVPQWPDCKCY
jgi:hypothetical protein